MRASFHSAFWMVFWCLCSQAMIFVKVGQRNRACNVFEPFLRPGETSANAENQTCSSQNLKRQELDKSIPPGKPKETSIREPHMFKHAPAGEMKVKPKAPETRMGIPREQRSRR